MTVIDLNCDMGESYGAWRMGDDAGSCRSSRRRTSPAAFMPGIRPRYATTVGLAVEHRVAIGAHPSLPDLQGFGRRAMKISANECYDLVLYQAGAVEAFARAAGAPLHHVKIHGMLYNIAAKDAELADAIARATRDLGGGVMLYGLSGSAMMTAAAKVGVRAVGEVFADRSYQPDGTLTPRSDPGRDDHRRSGLGRAGDDDGGAGEGRDRFPGTRCQSTRGRYASMATSRVQRGSPALCARRSRDGGSRSGRRDGAPQPPRSPSGPS